MPAKNIRSAIGIGSMALLLAARSLMAQEDAQQVSGLQLAAAMEKSLESAIAKAEKSIVAIARIKRKRDSSDAQAFDVRPVPFGTPPISASSNVDPTHPDFVPSEFGTGVIVDGRGLILTTYDVLGDPDDFKNTDYYITAVDGKVRQARIKAADPRSDLAVLAVEGNDLTPISLGDGSKLRKGQIVIALGNPYAIARDGQVSASWGIVSNLQRKAGRTPDEPTLSGKTTLHHLGTLIQTDAKLNLGTSGGALLNLQGEMVGLTTSLAAAAGYEQAAGYAIPVDDTFRRILEDLRNGKAIQYGFLGVQPSQRPEARVGRQGVLIEEVVRGAPAERAGIQPNDIITHIDDKPVYDFDGLVLRIGSQSAGEKVDLAVDRNGRKIPIRVMLAKYPAQGKAVVTQPEPAWRGVRVDYWTAVADLFRQQDHDQARSIDEEGCVVVTDVENDSPAAKAGLKPNMAITHIDGGRVSTPQEFRAVVEKMTGPVTIRIVGPTPKSTEELVVAAE